jgi:hypothetical protein
MKIDPIETLFADAFAYAIRKCGMATFKRTSMFGSNGTKNREFKKAA